VQDHCKLAPGELAVILHGAIPNANGAPVVDRWGVVISAPDRTLRIEEVRDFLNRTRLFEDTPNHALDDLEAAREFVPKAVDWFQTHLVALRRRREAEIERDLDAVLERLTALETRFKAQLTLNLDAIPERDRAISSSEKRRLSLRQAKEQQIERLFKDWTEWFERTRRMMADPNPHVDVKAVFVG